MYLDKLKDIGKRDIVQKYITSQKIFHINAFDLEHITKAVYGVSIEMTNSLNDTTHEYNISNSVSELERETIQDAIFNENLDCEQYGSILNDLCNKDLIQAGLYMVSISW